MANDKTFKVKNALEIGGSVKTSLGTITGSNIDLSTGNYFKDSPNVATYTISNPSPAQTFNLELTATAADVANKFSTTLYTGTGSSNTVTTGIDLSGSNEGLVWIKKRGTGSTYNHNLFDTVRGATKWLVSDDTDAEGTRSTGLSAFNSNGFTEGGSGWTGESGKNFVAWTWKSAPSFFDVVTWTGNGTARAISHNLGSVPGMVLYKNLSSAYGWQVYHRGMAVNRRLELNEMGSASSSVGYWDQTTPVTSSVLNIGADAHVNNNGNNYVAYVFGHETGSDSMIQCGSFTGNGSASGPSINLGWSPQWLMIRNEERSSYWRIIDTARDFSSTATRDGLFANSNANEDTTSPLIIARTSTGFDIKDNSSQINHSGENIIYVAIREATDVALTWPGTVKWPAGITPTAPAIGETDLYTFTTDDSGSSYYGYLSGDNLS